ncbi:hypothetical protein [Pyxidicoccus xibeiensis]|uniref:hypothetical protein n=1 Tax=Pyxidicoccus xibeiensis TaxID=2906759 RepID=UPI0020A71224|nr:hypothetical protein [Pyxidicoccus xibeiensis]MCP3137656.1 hypothetical protein [Pyxidicoccus xibeiensis]
MHKRIGFLVVSSVVLAGVGCGEGLEAGVSPEGPERVAAGAPGSKENPIVAQLKVIRVQEQEEQHASLGRCTVRTVQSEVSAPGHEPFLATETYRSCERGPEAMGSGDSSAMASSGNVNQYAPAPSYTCTRGQGLTSNWAGSGTIETQYVSYESGGGFYIAYGSAIGLGMGPTLSWSFGGSSSWRIYAATMRTSGTLSGKGTSCS